MSDARRPDDQARHSTDNPADTLRQAGSEARVKTAELGAEAKGAAGRLRDEATGAVQDVKAEGGAVIEAARQRAAGFAEEQKEAGAAQAKSLADATHRAADQFRDASPQLARYVHEAASSVESLARALRERSPGELIGQAEDLARRQPVAFFGAAVLAGFALARFARSSAGHDQPERSRTARLYDEPSRGGIATPRPAAMGAPGWVPDSGRPDDAIPSAHPATGPAATLGGAAGRTGPQGNSA